MFTSSARPRRAVVFVASLGLILLPAPPQARAAKQVFDVTGNWTGSAHNSTNTLDFTAALTGGHGKSITGTVSAGGITLPVHGSITPANTVKLQAKQGTTRITLAGHLDAQTVAITGTLSAIARGKKTTATFTMTRDVSVP